MKYFALVDFEYVEYLGECIDFSQAAEKADESNYRDCVNAIWSEESLRTVITNGKDALEKSK